MTSTYFFYDCGREAVEARTRPGKKFWDGDWEFFIQDRLSLEEARED